MSKSVLQERPHLIPSIIAALMLFGTLGQWPYVYYQLLRFVVCAVSVYVAYMSYNWQKIWAMWLFGIVAALFNPIVPVYLTREIWQPIDLICALLFVVITVVLKNPKTQKP